MNDAEPAYAVNEYTPDPAVIFDPQVGASYITYARRLVDRGYVQSSLGGMVIRVAHPDYPDGVCYAKPQGISLEEVEVDDLVITDIPYGRILHGEKATTVGPPDEPRDPAPAARRRTASSTCTTTRRSPSSPPASRRSAAPRSPSPT